MSPDPFALWSDRFPRACEDRLAPFFPRALIQRVRLDIVTDWRALVLGTLGMEGASVRGHTLYVYPGVLDGQGSVQDPRWSWHHAYGVSQWIHEVVHVQQYEESGWWNVGQYVVGLARSWANGAWYTHKYFRAEREASAYALACRKRLQPGGDLAWMLQ